MKKSKQHLFRLAIVLSIVCLINSCTTVKPYQRSYLKDSEMDLNSRSLEEFENSFQSYREGAVGGNGGNIGGGCGCN